VDRLRLDGVGLHDHLCSIYQTDAERDAVAVPFLRIGLQRGEKCVYVHSGGKPDGIAQALAEADIPARIQGFPQIFHVALGVDAPIVDYRSSLAADKARYVRLTTGLLERGVRALERGAWFLSDAHTDDVIDETIAAVAAVARSI